MSASGTSSTSTPNATNAANDGSVDLAFLKWLRRFSVVEGISTLLLFFVAMPLKYVGGVAEAVTIVGTLHGFLFLGLVAMFTVGMFRIPLSLRLTVAGVVGAIVPFGPFVVDRWLGRVGRESGEQRDQPSPA